MASRESIVEAARDLLAEGGVRALSMRAVANRVGVSATAIYHYFENKDALVRAVVGAGFDRMESYLQGAAERFAPGSRERLYAFAEAYLRFALENRGYFQVLFSLGVQRPQSIESSPERSAYRLLLENVTRAIESGAIRRADPDLVAFHLWAYVHGLVSLLLTYGTEPAGGDADVEAALRLLGRLRPLLREGLRPESSGS